MAPSRFADQRGARAAFTVSFLASSALYLLLTAACSPALPGVALLFASRLPAVFMHILPGRPGGGRDPAGAGAGPSAGGAGPVRGQEWCGGVTCRVGGSSGVQGVGGVVSGGVARSVEGSCGGVA